MTSLRQHLDQRLKSLEHERRSFWSHWRELATYILPRRYKWLITPNEQSGGMLNGAILDSTGTIAVRTLAAGMMSGITSPTRPWFKLRIVGVDTDETSPASIWLAECEKLMMRVFQESNFYSSMAVVYSDLSVFGTAAQLIYEDREDIIRCHNPALGEFYVAISNRLNVDTFYRQFVWNVKQIVDRFGYENCSQNIKSLYDQGGQGWQQELKIAHAVEPNNDDYSDVPQHFPWRECYWELGSGEKDSYLEARGFFENPALCSRWDVTANDAYGRSPGMDALGDIKQLQQETKRKAQAIDKLVNPPVLADIQLKNQPASLLPGGVTYVAGLDAKNGMRPIYQVAPPINELMEDIREIQLRIQGIFFNDLFKMFQMLEAEPRSAAAVDARREEKLIMLGPVLERFENEALDPAIDRTFNIMSRAGLFPPPPEEIAGAPIQIQYVSMLAEAQRAVATSGIERVLALAGNLAAINPAIMDKIDMDQALDDYGNFLSVSPKIIRSDEDVAMLREERAKREAEDRALAITAESVNAAKTLSETELGGGKTALQQMMQ